MLNAVPHPTVYAHRGASAHTPENTLVAFELAVQQGADAIELDAKLSRDGQVVVIHDMSVDRTTGAHRLVKDMPLAALRALDAGSHFDIDFKGERIPTLEEVFDAFGKRIFFNVELTNYNAVTDQLPNRVAALVQQYGLSQRVLFSSFHPLTLIRIHRLLPEAPTALNAFGGVLGVLSRSWIFRLLGCQALHPVIEDVTPLMVKRFHHQGVRVNPHTANRAEDIRRMVDLQVDGFFTNDPALARQVLSGLPATQ